MTNELEKEIAELRETRDQESVIHAAGFAVRVTEKMVASDALKIIESLQAEIELLKGECYIKTDLNYDLIKENQQLREKLDYAATVIECFQSYFDHKNQDRLLKELEEIEKAGKKFDTKETKGESNER